MMNANIRGISLSERLKTPALLILLIASVACMVRFSILRLFWGDESLTYYTVLGKTFLQMLHFQASTPIVFEPPTNDLLLLASAKIFGYSVFALRLPSIFFFVVTQILIYKLVHRRFGALPGVVAAGLLLIIAARSFGAEARPYQLIICTAVAALYCFVVSIEAQKERTRLFACAGITLSIALAATSQFYGVLVALPVMVAAGYQNISERRWNRGLWVAISIGLLSVLLDYPFYRAVQQYQAHFVRERGIGYRYFIETYTSTIRPLPLRLLSIPHLQNLLYLLLLGIAIVASFPSRRESSKDRALWLGLVSLALIPLPVLVIAFFVTKTYSPRHSIEFVGGLAPLLVAAIFTQLERRNPAIKRGLGLAMVVLIIVAVVKWQESLEQIRSISEAPYKTTPAVKAALGVRPELPIFLTIEECLEFPFYGEKEYAGRIRCVFSQEREIQFDHQVISSMTAQAIAHHTEFPLPFVTYEEMKASDDVYLAYMPVPWMTWLAKSIEQDRATVLKLGAGFGGEVEQLRFPNTH